MLGELFFFFFWNMLSQVTPDKLDLDHYLLFSHSPVIFGFIL